MHQSDRSFSKDQKPVSPVSLPEPEYVNNQAKSGTKKLPELHIPDKIMDKHQH